MLKLYHCNLLWICGTACHTTCRITYCTTRPQQVHNITKVHNTLYNKLYKKCNKWKFQHKTIQIRPKMRVLHTKTVIFLHGVNLVQPSQTDYTEHSLLFTTHSLSLCHSAAKFVSNSWILFSVAGQIISPEAVVWNQQLWTNIFKEKLDHICSTWTYWILF